MYLSIAFYHIYIKNSQISKTCFILFGFMKRNTGMLLLMLMTEKPYILVLLTVNKEFKNFKPLFYSVWLYERKYWNANAYANDRKALYSCIVGC